MEKVEKKEIVLIDPKEFGLTDQTAKNIKAQFLPMLNKMEELEEEYNEIVNLPIDSKETQNMAKQLRQKYVKVRTGTAKIHKEQKDFYLKGGKFVDGWKNAQIMASSDKEDRLKEIEEYEIRLEQKKQDDLHEERLSRLSPYIDDSTGLSLGSMPEDVWQAYLTGKKKSFEDLQVAQAEARRQEEARNKSLQIQSQRIKILGSNISHVIDKLENGLENLYLLTEDDFADIVEVADNLAKKDSEERAAASKRQAELESFIQKTPYKDDKSTQTDMFNEDLSDEQRLLKWIDSASIDFIPELEDRKSMERAVIINGKFESFKIWAKNQVRNG